MHDADERNEVGSGRQYISAEAATRYRHTIGKSAPSKKDPRPLGDSREIKQTQLQTGVLACKNRKKHALTATHIKHPAMSRKWIGTDHIFANQMLRRRHKSAVFFYFLR